MFPSSGKPPPPKPFGARGSSSFARDPNDSHLSSSPLTPPPIAAGTPPQLPPSSQPAQPPVPAVAYYRPSIYSYTCRGAWFVSSTDQYSEGKCRGIQSRLELLADMDDSTRDVAIKNFTYMTDYELDEDDPDPHHAGSTSGSPGGNGLNQKTKSILISPALIYKEKVESSTTDNNLSSPRQPPPPTPPRPTIEMPGVTASTALPEEELIKKQKWSCYGSTEVELLVLQNLATGSEHIAAVAPRNVGVSVRKIDADDGSITSIGIGWLNIVVDAGPSFLDDDDEEEDAATSQQHSQQSAQRSGDPLDKQRQGQSASAALPAASSLSTPEEVPARPSQDSIARARTQLKKYYEFAGKVGEQMKANVSFLKDTVQDDFVRRSIAAGTRIVDNVPRTVDKTATFLQKMLDKWAGGGGGGDGGDGAGGEDAGSSGPGGRGPGP